MYSKFPLMYDSELTIRDLGTLPSSAREWKNIKEHELKRGLWNPIRTDDPSFAGSDLDAILLNNSGIANQEDIFKGRVRKPNRYSQVTDLQAYIQLVRDVQGREPTDEELIMASADDVGLDARLIELINAQSEKDNLYATESQNFQRTLQKSVNNYFREDAKYKVPMQLEEEGFPSLFDLATISGRKRLERKALKPLDAFRSRLREAAKAGKLTAKIVSFIASQTGFPITGKAIDALIMGIDKGLKLDRLLSKVEKDPSKTITEDVIIEMFPASGTTGAE